MRQPIKRKNSSFLKGLFPFILISVVIHTFLFFLKVDFLGDFEEERLVNIQYYDIENTHQEKAEEKVKIPEKKKEELHKGQIVDIAKPEIEKKPDKSKFLSQFDSSVDKETKADFDKNIEKRGKKLQKSLSAELSGKEINDEEKLISGDVDKPASEDLKKIKKGKLEGFDGIDGEYVKGEEKPESGVITSEDTENIEGSEFVGGRSIPRRFLPYMGGRDSNLVSPSNDYLKDIDKSDETALNTYKYIYAAYFNKIKQAVSRHWTPAYVIMINDPRGHIYGRKDRYTKIIAIINSNGSLASIKLDTSSGMDFLDREAINAFKMAAPFHNPPEALLDENGTLEIRFGFMVTME